MLVAMFNNHIVLFSSRSRYPCVSSFYRTPLDSDEATTLESRPLYDQAQPGGADWRSILKDIQAKRKQLRDKEKLQTRDETTLVSEEDSIASEVSDRSNAAVAGEDDDTILMKSIPQSQCPQLPLLKLRNVLQLHYFLK